MSASPEASGQTPGPASDSQPKRARLIVRSRIGVTITVADGDYKPLSQGTVQLSLLLPPGVYIVDWLEAGRRSRKPVRLFPISEPLEVEQPEDGAQPFDLALTHPGNSKETAEAPLPSTRERGSEIVVRVISKSESGEPPLAPVRLANASGEEMRSDGAETKRLQKTVPDAGVVRAYRVTAGLYTLRYLSETGDTIEQTIPAMRNRQTVIVLTAAVGTVLVPQGESYSSVSSHGVDATRSIVISTPRSRPRDLSETLRLGDILLRDLSTGDTSLGRAFIKYLDRPDTDPLLRLYAAAVILARLDRNLSPSLEQPRPDLVADAVRFRRRWRDIARRWVRARRPMGSPPDFICASWRIDALSPGPSEPRRRLTQPPMLDVAWRWATARSALDPEAIPTSPSFAAAAGRTGGGAPWLFWRLAAGQARSSGGGARQTLPELIDLVAAKVADRLPPRDFELSSETLAADPLADLTPEQRGLAVKTWTVAAQAAHGGGSAPATLLAQRTAAPSRILAQDLRRLLVALDGQTSGPSRKSLLDGADVPSADDAPAMRRSSIDQYDPHLLRFGGKASRDGFELRASFGKMTRSDWVNVRLELRAPSSMDGQIAWLYLHETIKPDERLVTFKGGKVIQNLVLWGGFTIGVWVPSQGVELELNLAKVRGAPAGIRKF